MKRCRVCNTIVDYAGLGLELIICTSCVQQGALAGKFSEDSPEGAIKKVMAKNQKPVKVKLDMGYVWHEKTWWLDIKAILPDGSPFNLGISQRDLEKYLEEMDKLEEPDETPPTG